MDSCALKLTSSSSIGVAANACPYKFSRNYNNSVASFVFRVRKIRVFGSASDEVESSSVRDAHRRISSLESLFCYDKPIPEERIEKPVGVSMDEKVIENNPRCNVCEAKGAVLCATCSGTGLYVDSIMESQGIIVKVRCLGCGGTGNIMCLDCGGRGHLG